MKKIVSILIGIACVGLFCANIFISTGKANSYNSLNLSFSNSKAHAESGEPDLCMIGTITTEGEIKLDCGTCEDHYMKNFKGDGACGG